ncbi:MAG: hypothetical protein ACC683_06090 [Acidimicrobiia bacterium]
MLRTLGVKWDVGPPDTLDIWPNVPKPEVQELMDSSHDPGVETLTKQLRTELGPAAT